MRKAKVVIVINIRNGHHDDFVARSLIPKGWPRQMGTTVFQS